MDGFSLYLILRDFSKIYGDNWTFIYANDRYFE